MLKMKPSINPKLKASFQHTFTAPIKIKARMLNDCGNKFISILSHVQKQPIYSLQTTDQVYEAND